MEFLRIRGFRRGRKKEEEVVRDPEEESGRVERDGNGRDAGIEVEDDEDDDFITEEVKRRLKELRKGSFMVLIPEEECLEDEDGVGEGGSSSSEWREEAEAEEEEDGEGYASCGFDAFYADYCQRMAFFDNIAKKLLDAGFRSYTVQSPKSISKKAVSSLWNIPFKKKDGHDNDAQHMRNSEDSPHENLETVYVAQISLSWEALYYQYKHLWQKVLSRCETSCCYSYACQAFQQFQVLLQRFIENEPFEDGSRVETYTRARKSLPLFLQIPRYQELELKDQDDDYNNPTPASDLLKIIEESILTFHHFLKIEKNNRSLFGGQKQAGNMLQLLQNSLSKKEAKLKEFYKKKRSERKELGPRMKEEIELLSALIDIKIISRVLRMDKISKQQLLWCEQKMSNLDITEKGMHRHGFPVIFPC